MQNIINIRLGNKNWLKFNKETANKAETAIAEKNIDESFRAIEAIKKLRRIFVKLGNVKGNELNYDEVCTTQKLIRDEVERAMKEITCNPYELPNLILTGVEKKEGARIKWVRVKRSVEYEQNDWAFDIAYENRTITVYGIEKLPNNAKWLINNPTKVTADYDRTFGNLEWIFE